MNFTLRRATLLPALTLPSLCWGFGSPPNALIVTESLAGPDINSVAAFLMGRMFPFTGTITVSGGRSAIRRRRRRLP
jgi:hypothetical protein